MKVKLLEYGVLPKKGRADDAGYDIFIPKNVILKANSTTVIDSGVCVELPHGYAGMMVVRSSTSQQGIIVQPPLIDENYRGEIHIIVLNTTNHDISVAAGQKICSLVIFPVFNDTLEEVSELSPSSRGTAWNGSSGK